MMTHMPNPKPILFCSDNQVDMKLGSCLVGHAAIVVEDL